MITTHHVPHHELMNLFTRYYIWPTDKVLLNFLFVFFTTITDLFVFSDDCMALLSYKHNACVIMRIQNTECI